MVSKTSKEVTYADAAASLKAYFSLFPDLGVLDIRASKLAGNFIMTSIEQDLSPAQVQGITKDLFAPLDLTVVPGSARYKSVKEAPLGMYLEPGKLTSTFSLEQTPQEIIATVEKAVGSFKMSKELNMHNQDLLYQASIEINAVFDNAGKDYQDKFGIIPQSESKHNEGKWLDDNGNYSICYHSDQRNDDFPQYVINALTKAGLKITEGSFKDDFQERNRGFTRNVTFHIETDPLQIIKACGEWQIKFIEDQKDKEIRKLTDRAEEDILAKVEEYKKYGHDLRPEKVAEKPTSVSNSIKKYGILGTERGKENNLSGHCVP